MFKAIVSFADEFVRFAASAPILIPLALILLFIAVWMWAVIVFAKFFYGILTDRKKLQATGILVGIAAGLVSVIGFVFGVQSFPELFELLREP